MIACFMKKFIVIYYAPKEMMEQMKNVSPKQAKKGMKAWMDWKEKQGDGVVDLGAPLMNGQRVTPDGTSPSVKEIAGYRFFRQTI